MLLHEYLEGKRRGGWGWGRGREMGRERGLEEKGGGGGRLRCGPELVTSEDDVQDLYL